MNRAFLSLGGNLGDRLETLKKAVQLIKKQCGPVLKTSSIYETEAWGTLSNNNYLNLVVKIETTLSPRQLLKKTLSIEKKLGRKRSMHLYEDRTIDIDILLFNHKEVKNKDVQIPHPRLHLRKFVLVPLNELAGKLKHPVFNESISSLLKSCEDISAVHLYRQKEKVRHICIEGNIGSGKTTLATALAKHTGGRLISEKFAHNPLLPLFYKDPVKYAFLLEFSFLMERFAQMQELSSDGSKLIISDYSFQRSLWFAKLNLSTSEFRIFRKYYKALAAQVPEPSLIVFLSTDVRHLKQNIVRRGRTFEQDISDTYLKTLNKKYRKVMHEKKGPLRMTIGVSEYNRDSEKRWIGLIENFLKENFGQAT